MKPQPISHVLETCLYVRSMETSTAFYRDKLLLRPAICNERLTTFPLGNTLLILFQRGLTWKDGISDAGIVPAHGIGLQSKTDEEREMAKNITLSTHFCLAVEEPDQVREWEAWFASEQVKVLGTMAWPKGGRSVYFEDPDGHVGEIGSRGIWDSY